METRSFRIAFCLASAFFAPASLGQGGVMHTLPLPQGATSAVGTHLSADGSSVVIVGSNQAARWFARVQRLGGEGFELGALGSNPFVDQGFVGPLSADGTTAFGGATNLAVPSSVPPWRWTASGGRVELPVPAGWSTPHPIAIAPDGSFIVGGIVPAGAGGFRACRWVGNGAPELLAPVPNMVGSSASMVTRDGTIYGAAGTALVGASRVVLVRWTNAGAMAEIVGELGQSPLVVSYGDVSRNGAIFVGERTTDLTIDGRRAILSYSGSPPEDLPIPAGFTGSGASSVSPDGRYVGLTGFRVPSSSQPATSAFVWSRARGVQTPHEFLASHGADLTGWEVLGVSLRGESGRRCSGVGRFNGAVSAFYVDIESVVCQGDLDDGTRTGTPDGAVTIDDLLYFFVRFEEGSLDVDFDDGSMLSPGSPDGAVGIEDLLYYFRFLFDQDC